MPEPHEIQRRDRYYMDLVRQIATGSKCIRAHYGTLIVAACGRRIVSTAYNGKPAGSCNDGVCYRLNLPPNAPKENCCLHSEANAIMFSNPADRLGGGMYVSGVPCNDCGLLIMQSGVARLVYFDGAEALRGHVGSSTDAFWQKYGDPVIRVAYTDERWETLYGEGISPGTDVQTPD